MWFYGIGLGKEKELFQSCQGIRGSRTAAELNPIAIAEM
jgi:hypothetical protein